MIRIKKVENVQCHHYDYYFSSVLFLESCQVLDGNPTRIAINTELECVPTRTQIGIIISVAEKILT